MVPPSFKIFAWLLFFSATALVNAQQFGPPQILIPTGRSYTPHIAYGSNATWLIAMHSRGTISGTNDNESDILVSRSTNLGQNWTAPAVLVNTAASDTAEDNDPRLITDENGNWVLAYLTREPSGGGSGADLDLKVTRSTDNGLSWSAPAFLNSNALTDNAQDARVELATDSAGNVVAVWQSASVFNPAGTATDIAFSRSSDNGQTWSPIAPLDSNAGDDSLFNITPHVATNGQGRWVAVWTSNDTLGGTTGTDNDIVFSTSLNNGASWTPAAALNAAFNSDSASDLEPRVSCDAEGNWLVVWYSTSPATGSDTDIFYARSTNGTAWTSPKALNWNAPYDQGGDVFPRLVTDQGKNWIAYWCSGSNLEGSGSTDTNIVFATSGDGGAIWSNPVYLNTDAASETRDDYNCDIATDGQGRWIATWGLFSAANPAPIRYTTIDALTFNTAVDPIAWRLFQ